jgi:hypothetical protein
MDLNVLTRYEHSCGAGDEVLSWSHALCFMDRVGSYINLTETPRTSTHAAGSILQLQQERKEILRYPPPLASTWCSHNQRIIAWLW